MPKKTDSLLVRLTPLEKEGFAQAAEIAGISVASWIRERLRIVARRELDEHRIPVPFLQTVIEPSARLIDPPLRVQSVPMVETEVSEEDFLEGQTGAPIVRSFLIARQS